MIPKAAVFTDCTGVDHTFAFHARYLPYGSGVIVEANEVNDDGVGYAFASLDSHPMAAYFSLEKTIEKRLAVKYLRPSKTGLSMTHNELKGHIEDRGIVVDGRLVSYQELFNLIAQNYGQFISITIDYLDREESA